MMDGGERPGRVVAPVAVVVVLTLAVRLAVLLSVYAHDPSRCFAPDSYGYDRLARTLLETGRFEDADTGAAHTRRTPGYPALIAAARWLTGKTVLPVLLLQVLVSGGTILLTHWIGRRLWGPRAGLLAACCLALDVPSFLSTQQLLTETVFAFAVTSAAAAGTGLALGGRKLWALGLGVALTAAALVRPIAVYVVYPGLLWLAGAGHRLGWGRRRTVLAMALACVPWVVGVGGWTLRNGARTGRFEFSAAAGQFLLLSRGADIVAQRDGIAPAEARRELLRSVEDGDVPGRGEFFERGWSLLLRHPGLFLRTQVRWLPALLFGTGVGGLCEYLGISTGAPGTALLDTGPAAWLRTWGWLVALTFLASGLHLAIVYLAGARGLWAARNEDGPRLAVHALLLGAIAYFVLLSTAPTAYSRFRVPIMPLLSLYAGRGLSLGRPRFRRA